MDAFASTLKKKMDAKFASTIHLQISQSAAFLSLGQIWQNNFTNSSQNGLFYVQVH